MSLIYLRKAEESHLNRIMEIVANAQQNLKNDGVPQWQDGYPDKWNILADINANTLFEVMYEGEIAGIVAIQYTPELNYESLTGGEWLGGDEYATIHRLAIDSAFSRHGLGTATLISALTLIRTNGYTAVRIDTHDENRRVQHLVTKLGFEYRGVIHIIDPHGDLDTNAYELIMK